MSKLLVENFLLVDSSLGITESSAGVPVLQLTEAKKDADGRYRLSGELQIIDSKNENNRIYPVSYTHLTLPTN